MNVIKSRLWHIIGSAPVRAKTLSSAVVEALLCGTLVGADAESVIIVYCDCDILKVSVLLGDLFFSFPVSFRSCN